MSIDLYIEKVKVNDSLGVRIEDVKKGYVLNERLYHEKVYSNMDRQFLNKLLKDYFEYEMDLFQGDLNNIENKDKIELINSLYNESLEIYNKVINQQLSDKELKSAYYDMVDSYINLGSWMILDDRLKDYKVLNMVNSEDSEDIKYYGNLVDVKEFFNLYYFKYLGIKQDECTYYIIDEEIINYLIDKAEDIYSTAESGKGLIFHQLVKDLKKIRSLINKKDKSEIISIVYC